jgi:hypothetical protein
MAGRLEFTPAESPLVTLLVLATVAAVITQTSERPAITGVVQSDAGKPLKGATVFISTAAPRKGVGVL